MGDGEDEEGRRPERAWRPRRTGRWEERDRGVLLVVPRFGRGGFGRLMERWFRSRPYRIRLDEIGSFIWHRLDGERTVEEIAGQMEAEFGERVEPAVERLARFLASLARAQFLEPRDPGEPRGTMRR